MLAPRGQELTAVSTWPKVSDAVDRFLASSLVPLLIAWPPLALVVALSLFILYMTFVPHLPMEPGWTLEHWERITQSYVLQRVIPNTVVVGAGAVLVTMVFAVPLAWLLNRTTIPFRGVFVTLIAVTVLMPGFVKAMGWIMLLQGQIGLVNKLLMDAFGLATPPFNISTPLGQAWVIGLGLAPTMFFLIAGSMRGMDPSLEDAARVAGANGWRTLLNVNVPLVWPAILGGMIYTFMTAISMFEIPALLGGAGGQAPVLASELFYSVQPPGATAGSPRYGAAGVYGVLIALPSLIGLYFYLRLIARSHRFAVISGKAYRPRDVELGSLAWLGVGFVLLYLTLAVFLPLLVLSWASVLPYLQMPSLDALSAVTLQNYRDIMDIFGGPQVLRNTVVLVILSTLLVLLVSFMTSWVVVRTRYRFRKAMDMIAMLPHAIPGIGFAFALALVGIIASAWMPWLPLAGTIGILVLANVLNRVAFGTRITNAALLQVTSELEEAAWICGARSLGTMRRVLLPLVAPSLVYGGVWTALLVFREVSIPLMLAGPANELIATRIWTMWNSGDAPEAAAASVVMILVTGLVLLVAFILTGGRLTQQRLGAFGSGEER
jgi:iron(III) transport system permease protein